MSVFLCPLVICVIYQLQVFRWRKLSFPFSLTEINRGSSVDCHGNYSPRWYGLGPAMKKGGQTRKPDRKHQQIPAFFVQYQKSAFTVQKVYRKIQQSWHHQQKRKTDEWRTNISYTLQISNSFSFSAAEFEVIGPKCSPQLTYGNGMHKRNEKPQVKGSIVLSNGLQYVGVM